MIDLHAHILPGMDDGPKTWEEALAMARLAAADGITAMVATPQLFPNRTVESSQFNSREKILGTVAELRHRLGEADIALEILSGCEAPLFPDLMKLLKDGQVLTINDGRRYLSLEMPDTAIPPGAEDVCFQLQSQGITPIITHPERHFLFYEKPERLARLLRVGCLTQITAGSLTGRFGRQVARFARDLVKRGYVHFLASDAHDPKRRPPLLAEAFKALSKLVGDSQAREMMMTRPEKVLRGEDCI